MGWDEDAREESARTRRRARRTLRDMGFSNHRTDSPIRGAVMTHRPLGVAVAREHPDLFNAAHFHIVPGASVRQGARETGVSGSPRRGLTTDIQHSAVDLWFASIWGEEARYLSDSEMRVQRIILVVTAIIASLLLDLHLAVGWAAGSGLTARLLARLEPFAGRLITRFGVQGATRIASSLTEGIRVFRTYGAFAVAGTRLIGRSVGYFLGDIGENGRREIVRQLRQWDCAQAADILQDVFSVVDTGLDAISPIRTFCEDSGLDISEDLLRQLASRLNQR